MRIKKILSLALSAIMVFGMVSTQSFAEESGNFSGGSAISVMGKVLDYGYYLYSNGRIIESDKNNYNLHVEAYGFDSVMLNNYHGGEISISDTAIIAYNGTNTVTSSDPTIPAISCSSPGDTLILMPGRTSQNDTPDDTLKVVGADSLSHNGGDAIVSDAVSITNGSVTAIGGNTSGIDTSNGNGIVGDVHIQNGDHNISSGLDYADNYSFGISGKLEIFEASLKVSGHNGAVLSEDSISIFNSDLTAISKHDGPAIATMDTLDIAYSNVTATTEGDYGNAIQTGSHLMIQNSNVTATAKGSYSSAILTFLYNELQGGDTTILNSVVNATCEAPLGYGIMTQSLTVDNSELYATGGESYDHELQTAGFGILVAETIDVNNSYVQSSGYISMFGKLTTQNIYQILGSTFIGGSNPTKIEATEVHSYKYVTMDIQPTIFIDQDVGVTTTNRDDILNDGTASYDKSSNTLTLNGYDGNAIKATGDLNIHIIGTNTAESTDHKVPGISCEQGTLIFTAEDDNSTITARGYVGNSSEPVGENMTYGAGISAENIVINGGDIYTAGGKHSTNSTGGVGIYSSNITVNSANLTATGIIGQNSVASEAINAESLTINGGGKVSAIGGTAGINISDFVSIIDGNIYSYGYNGAILGRISMHKGSFTSTGYENGTGLITGSIIMYGGELTANAGTSGVALKKSETEFITADDIDISNYADSMIYVKEELNSNMTEGAFAWKDSFNTHKYVNITSYEFVTPPGSGDVDGNNTVDNADVMLLFQYTTNPSVQIDISASDMNDDDIIDNRDVLLLLNFISA